MPTPTKPPRAPETFRPVETVDLSWDEDAAVDPIEDYADLAGIVRSQDNDW